MESISNEETLSSYFGSTSDGPEKPLDWLLLTGIIIFTIPFLFSNGVIWHFRKRKYFQASNWVLLLGNSAAGVVWIFSALVVNQHFKRSRLAVLGFCSVWTFWFQLTLGICLWLSFLALRLHHIYVLCTTGRRLSCVRVWTVYVPLLLVPAVIFSAIATKLRASQHPCYQSTGLREYDICVISGNGWKLTSFLLIPPLYFSLIVLLLLRLRGKTDYLLNIEYQHMKEYALMAFVLYLLTGTTYWSNRQNNVEGRCFLTFCVCSLVFFNFWVHTWWPVYLCLFKGKQDLDKYEEDLRRRGAVCLDKVSSSCQHDANGNEIVQSFTLDGEDAILEAISVERQKLMTHKARKDYLQHRISQLQVQIESQNTQLMSALHSSLPRFEGEIQVEMVLQKSGEFCRSQW